jgi:hypothetical protein
VVFGGVLRVAAGMCSKIANLLEKPRILAGNFLEFVDKNRLVCLFMFERESIYLHPKLE